MTFFVTLKRFLCLLFLPAIFMTNRSKKEIVSSRILFYFYVVVSSHMHLYTQTNKSWVGLILSFSLLNLSLLNEINLLEYNSGLNNLGLSLIVKLCWMISFANSYRAFCHSKHVLRCFWYNLLHLCTLTEDHFCQLQKSNNKDRKCLQKNVSIPISVFL